MGIRMARVGVVACMVLSLAGAAIAAGESPANGVTILGPRSILRGWVAYRTPVQIGPQSGDQPAATQPVVDVLTRNVMVHFQSPMPPAGWAQRDYDDSGWSRYRGSVETERGSATGHNHAGRHVATASSAIFLRGNFLVDDPTKATDLTLTIEYVGGAVIYLNGQEIGRADLPAGELRDDTMARAYPDDLHCLPDGNYIEDPAKNKEGFDRRYRTMKVTVPAKALRPGSNVLAMDLRRAPLNERAIDAKRIGRGGMSTVMGMWAYVGLKGFTLTGEPNCGVRPSAGRPAGIQIWNVSPFETVNSTSYGETADLKPITIHAARNSVFSGRLMVSSTQPIKGFKVTVGELATADGAKLPASVVGLRWSEPAVAGRSFRTGWNWSHHLFDGLLDSIPTDIAPLHGTAAVPLWFTARVPKDAKPGRYAGKVTIGAVGLAATDVPLVVTVHDWVMSDPVNFRVKSLAFTSQHEAMARHYGVPFWSPKHMEMLGESLALMSEAGSRQALVNMSINWYWGDSNSESMVRWVKQEDGGYKYDFTVFDAYLDVIAKRLGKPHPLRLNCWGQMSVDAKTKKAGWSAGNNVSLLVDAETGKTAPLAVPPPDEPDNFVAFWKPVLDEARKKIEARGWFDSTCLGHNAYCDPPTPQVVSMAHRIWPDGCWGITGHAVGLGPCKGAGTNDTMPCRFSEVVWTEGGMTHRGWTKLAGPPRNDLWCSNCRNRHSDASPLTVIRDLPEEVALRGHAGVGQLGVDNFPIKRPDGKIYSLGNDRGGTGPQCSTSAILAPGPNGPVATERYEMFREGVELCEAIIFLEESIRGGKLNPDLAARVNRCLNERSTCFLRGYSGHGGQDVKPWSAGRADRDVLLLSLCGEVAAASRKP